MYQVKQDGAKFILIGSDGKPYLSPRTGKPESYAHSGAARKAAETLNKRSGR